MKRFSIWTRRTLFVALLPWSIASQALPVGGGDPPGDDFYAACVERSRATFSAAPASINRGQNTTLQWSVFPAAGCSWMKNVKINGVGLLEGLVGSRVVQPSITQDFSLMIPIPARPGQSIGMTATRVTVHFPGALDTTFSGSGQAFVGGVTGEGYSTAAYADGRSLLVGATPPVAAGQQYAVQRQMLVARFTKNGLLDPTFGAGGKLLIDFPGYSVQMTRALLLVDQRIVLAGSACLLNRDVFHPICEIAAVRLLPGGQFDPSFGFGGKIVVTLSDANNSAWLSSLVRDPLDGSYLIATSGSIVRLKSTGGLDASFGQSGRFILTPIGTPLSLSAIAIQSNGKIVLAGTTNNHMMLARLSRNGILDETFGNRGIALQTFVLNGQPGLTLVFAMALQRDDRILVGGKGTASTYNAAVLRRFTKDGLLDPTFEGKEVGLLLPDFWWVMALAVQPDNKIMVAGGFGPSTAAPSFAVRRLQANGAPDNAYGINSLSTIAGGFFTSQLVVQSRGCTLLAGTRRPTLDAPVQPVLVRFEGDPAALPLPGAQACYVEDPIVAK